MNKGKLGNWIIAFFVVMLALINTYAPDGILKAVGNALSILGVCYGVANRYLDHLNSVKLLNYRLRRHSLLKFLVPENGRTTAPDGGYLTFKEALLEFTRSQLESRQKELNDPDMFSFDFEIKPKFSEGTRSKNRIEGWREHMGERFSFLIGYSGSGKTFELVRRASYACESLKRNVKRIEQMAGKKIPLYIELKSLQLPLHDAWIVEYLTKSASIKNKKLDPLEVERLLNDLDVIFFFDGLDEVDPAWRLETLQQILVYAERTGVYVTCRNQLFNELLEGDKFSTELLPAIYHFQPLAHRKIRQVIRDAPVLETAQREEIFAYIDRHPKVMRHLSRSIMLNMAMIVWKHLTEEEKLRLPDAHVNDFTNIIWKHYESHIAWKKLSHDADALTLRTASMWIAKIMEGDSFSVESIQPFWLKKVNKSNQDVPEHFLRTVYYLTTRILAAVVIGVAMGCLIATPLSFISPAILGGVIISIIAGVYKLSKPETPFKRTIEDLGLSFSMLVLLAGGCGIYQGFCVPRANSDMLADLSFSPTETWPGILLGIALSTIFIYRIILEKKGNIYILPREKFHFSPGHALRYGLSWGGMSGILTGAIALYVKHRFRSALFIKDWLIPFLKKLVGHQYQGTITDLQLDVAIFLYAFGVTFFVASIIIMLMAGRYNEPKADDADKQRLNYGIFTSLLQAIGHGVGVFFLACVLYYIAMFRIVPVSWTFCIKISTGIGILTFLWYGGMEVINHWLLRLSLSLHGIAPLRYKSWFESNRNMGLIIPTGFSMRFYHPSLERYYRNAPMDDNVRAKLWPTVWQDHFFYTLAIVFSGIMIYVPLQYRYDKDRFGHGIHDVNVHQKYLKSKGRGTYSVLRTGEYMIKASGISNVGTFVGYVEPSGTIYGFMGMPIDSAYNLHGFGRFRHAALLLRISKKGVWSAYRYASSLRKPLHLDIGDQFEVLVNDKEPENNHGRFTLTLNPIKNKNLLGKN